MTFDVEHNAGSNAAVLSHTGSVDLEEIQASRVRLKDIANTHQVRGAIIDIVDAEITARPVDIIGHVEDLVDDLRPGTRLAFVARGDEQQAVVAMIVTTVAHKSGTRVQGFTSREDALDWIRTGRAQVE